MITCRLLLAYLAFTVSLGVQAGSQTVYRSVSQDGTVSFSDTPPTDASATVLDVAFSSATPEAAATDRLRELRETTDRIVADRLAREEHRANLRKLRAETAAAQRSAQPLVVEIERDTTYYPYAHRRAYRSAPTLPRLRSVESVRQPSLSEQLRRRTSTSQVYSDH